MGALVSRVDPGSVAARYGIIKGDEIITINGQLLRDILDYYFLTSEHKLEINFLRKGFPRTTVIHKKAEEPLGLDFTTEVFDGIIPCRNKCVFCFVDQLPRDVRRSLCVKDDDYRLSFLHGSYITLTNLAENDLRRITALRLSPLYVSIHATDPEVRAKMMGNPQAGNLMKMLNKLKLHNIQCHTQIVVVPGYNDGNVLKKTLSDLLNLYPTVKTVAIVPVGLTGHRHEKNLEKIEPFAKKHAQQVHDIVASFQDKARKRLRFPFFYMADEIYLLMEKDFPPHKDYGYFDQLANGVGMTRKLYTDFNRRKRYLPKEIDSARNVWIVTGVLGEKVIKPLMENFTKIKRLKVRLIPIKNKFMGSPTTVTGLVAGSDVIAQLSARLRRSSKPDVILLPDVVLREGQFIDDVSMGQIEDQLKIPVKEVPADAQGLIEGIIGQRKKSSATTQKKHSRVVAEAHRHMESKEIPLKDVENAPEATKAKPLRPTGADREPKADWSKDYRPGMNARRPRRKSTKPIRRRKPAVSRPRKDDRVEKPRAQEPANKNQKEQQDQKTVPSRSRRSRGSRGRTRIRKPEGTTSETQASQPETNLEQKPRQTRQAPNVEKPREENRQQQTESQETGETKPRTRSRRSRGYRGRTRSSQAQEQKPGEQVQKPEGNNEGPLQTRESQSREKPAKASRPPRQKTQDQQTQQGQPDQQDQKDNKPRSSRPRRSRSPRGRSRSPRKTEGVNPEVQSDNNSNPSKNNNPGRDDRREKVV